MRDALGGSYKVDAKQRQLLYAKPGKEYKPVSEVGDWPPSKFLCPCGGSLHEPMGLSKGELAHGWRICAKCAAISLPYGG